LIGVIVPAHNEEMRIEACVKSLLVASRDPFLRHEAVEVVVVIDNCQDRTGYLARSLGVRTMDVLANNVGVARQIGAEVVLAAGARWLAFTDSDTTVAPDWLSTQLALNADAVCGTVSVQHWAGYGSRMARHFELTYADRDGHSHIHGANLGVSSQAYRIAGGFLNLASGEDVALVRALQRTHARIVWSSKPRVMTSARLDYKAPRGFGATLERIDRLHQWAGDEGACVT
jgi:glycosyltransferase involved in cell wall biosynthesis